MSSLTQRGQSFALDLADSRRISAPIQEGQVDDLHVSPDGLWLAYREVGADTLEHLVVADRNNQQIQRLPWLEPWRHIAGWLTDQEIAISQRQTTGQSDTLLILDPFADVRKELNRRLPGFFDTSPGPGWGWYNYSGVVYDSKLERAIYPGSLDSLVILDMVANLPVTVITDTISLNVLPRWSPDGQHLVVTIPTATGGGQEVDDLVVLDRDGHAVRLTTMAQHYSMASFSNYSWSPDGDRIALAVATEPRPTSADSGVEGQTTYSLVIVDLSGRELMNSCVPGRSQAPPVWSPDGRQIAVENSDSIDQSQLYLLDLDQNVASVIQENVTVVGWMK